MSSSKHESKVSTIQERRTGQKRQNNVARFSWDCNGSSQRILFAKRSTWSCPWSETKKTPFGAHLWMYFSSVNRSCFKLFLFSTVLLNITLLKMGFIVVQWENENSVSVLNEKKVVGAVELKEGTINSWHIDWFKQRSSGHLKLGFLEVCGEYKLPYSLRDQNLIKE